MLVLLQIKLLITMKSKTFIKILKVIAYIATAIASGLGANSLM